MKSAQFVALLVGLTASFVLPVIADPQASGTPPVTILRAEARMVQIDVVVTDSRGKPVTDLTKQDFTITDEGKPRVLDIFGVNTGQPAATSQPRGSISSAASQLQLPLNTFSNRDEVPPADPGHSTVIVLDQVNAFLEDAAYARDQAMSLMKKLPPDERIALYVIARREGLVELQDYTADHALLLKNLSKYAPRGLMPSNPPPATHAIRDGEKAGPGGGAAAAISAFANGADQPLPPGIPPGPPPPPMEEKLSQWYQNSAAARLSLQTFAERLALVPGRKSIYWVTQGFPSWVMKEKRMGAPPSMEKPAWDKTITALNEADVALNTVDARGLFRGGNPNEGTLDTMQEVAGRTGGKAYFGRNDLDTAMQEGIEASRVGYTLGFYLVEPDRDDKFHALKVQVDRPGLQLFYRQGYYAGNTEMPDASKNKPGGSDLESVLLSQADSTDIGVTARIDSINPGSPRGTVNFRINLDPSTVSLKEQASGWTGTIDEMFVELNDSGATLSKVSEVKEFEITRDNRQQYETGGITWLESMPLISDAAKFVIIIRDTKTGRVGSLRVPLK